MLHHTLIPQHIHVYIHSSVDTGDPIIDDKAVISEQQAWLERMLINSPERIKDQEAANEEEAKEEAEDAHVDATNGTIYIDRN